jgi:prevent-host-death family protein
MKTELIATFKRKATAIIASVTKNRDQILITQHERPAASLVDVETFKCMPWVSCAVRSFSRSDTSSALKKPRIKTPSIRR